ncbi:MAG: arginine repressor [Planctomycetes bacterium]|nr:arginine repressor [Planctomycetota bacterium]
MREARQDAIRRCLKAGVVATQQELLDKLKAKGIRIDQSTLSRDLAELGARKSGGRYVLAETRESGPTQVDYGAAVRSFQPCGPHLIVIRTDVGQAQPVALMIDLANETSVVATLAGDDTIFVATKSSKTQAVALRRLETWFGDKRVR